MTLELCRVESCVLGRVTLYMYVLQIRGIDQMECDSLAYFHFLTVQSYYYSWGWEAN